MMAGLYTLLTMFQEGPGPVRAALQTTPGMAPLPADPPIGGVIWTIVIPAILLFGSCMGTYLLYKRFAKEEGE